MLPLSNVPRMVLRTQVTASDAVYHVSQVSYMLEYPLFAICLRKVVKMGTSGSDSGQQPWDHIRAEAVGTQPKRRLCLQLTDKHNLLVLKYRGACGIQHWILWTCFVPFGFVRPSGHPVTAKPSDVQSLYRSARLMASISTIATYSFARWYYDIRHGPQDEPEPHVRAELFAGSEDMVISAQAGHERSHRGVWEYVGCSGVLEDYASI